MEDTLKSFKEIGGEFVSSPEAIKEKLQTIKAFVFDWDGVFNNGRKGEGKNSGFAEADSMGINMLRFGHWLTNNQQLPLMAIITGEDNPDARYFAKREHFAYVFSKCKNKIEAIDEICQRHNLGYDEIAFFYDDILDLSAAKVCGVNFCIRRNVPPFLDYVRGNGLCDYITGNTSGNYALREASELILTLRGNFEEALNLRIAYGEEYKDYISERNSLDTEFKSFAIQE